MPSDIIRTCVTLKVNRLFLARWGSHDWVPPISRDMAFTERLRSIVLWYVDWFVLTPIRRSDLARNLLSLIDLHRHNGIFLLTTYRASRYRFARERNLHVLRYTPLITIFSVLKLSDTNWQVIIFKNEISLWKLCSFAARFATFIWR